MLTDNRTSGMKPVPVPADTSSSGAEAPEKLSVLAVSAPDKSLHSLLSFRPG